MELLEITADEYGKLVGDEVPVFYRKDFLELNKGKVEKVRFLLGKDKKNRLVLAVGEKNGQWKAPYSAPFANFVELRKDTTIDTIWEFVRLVNEYALKNKIESINIYLPSDIYGVHANSKIINALLGNGYRIQFQDVNYSFDLKEMDVEKYDLIMQYNARKNLNIALKSELVLVRCESYEEKTAAYEIIRVNRELKGYPLHMTCEQVMETINIVKNDFFIVKRHGKGIASAIVYHITNKIAQVVYWGDIDDVGQYKPINFLAYHLIKYYKEQGFEYLDVGISTVEGIPNVGLCGFKESLGCEATAKYRFQIDFANK